MSGQQNRSGVIVALVLLMIFLLFGGVAAFATGPPGVAFGGIFFLFFIVIIIIVVARAATQSGPGVQRPYTQQTAFSPPPSTRHNTSQMRLLRDEPTVQRKMRWLRGAPSETQSQLASLQAQRSASKPVHNPLVKRAQQRLQRLVSGTDRGFKSHPPYQDTPVSACARTLVSLNSEWGTWPI